MDQVTEKPKTLVVSQVSKKIRMDLWDIVKFQISVHCIINKVELSDQEVNCMSLLALSGNQELTTFCVEAIRSKLSNNTQSIRNALAKITEKGLILKTGKSKKRISINPNMNIQVNGNIILDYKITRIDPSEI